MEPQSPELVQDYQVHDGSIILITSKGPMLNLDDLAINLNGREVLSEFDYNQNFPKPNTNSKTRLEASRAMDEVTMDHKALANDCLNELFPTIVSNAKMIHALSPGKDVDNPDGSVQLMYKEIQFTDPLLPNMKLIFNRICKQMDDGCWVVVDASFDPPKDAYYPSKFRRLPSGCLIQSIGNGLSKSI
ncbi:homeobox-leucine zipper protein HDG11-like protein [Tanacetum coccineum]